MPETNQISMLQMLLHYLFNLKVAVAAIGIVENLG